MKLHGMRSPSDGGRAVGALPSFLRLVAHPAPRLICVETTSARQLDGSSRAVFGYSFVFWIRAKKQSGDAMDFEILGHASRIQLCHPERGERVNLSPGFEVAPRAPPKSFSCSTSSTLFLK
jgi:hypothetical protein